MATNPMKPPQNMPLQDAETPADAAAPGEEADTGVELCIKIADDGTLDPDNDGVACGAVLASSGEDVAHGGATRQFCCTECNPDTPKSAQKGSHEGE